MRTGVKQSRSTWVTKLANDETITIAATASYGGDWGKDAGVVNVAVIAGDSSWMEERKGSLHIERGTRYEFGRVGDREFDVVKRAAVTSLGGDVVGHGKSVKAAIEDYGSQVAKLVIEQRRRAALVEGAAKLSNREAVTVTLTPEQASELLFALDGAGLTSAAATQARNIIRNAGVVAGWNVNGWQMTADATECPAG